MGEGREGGDSDLHTSLFCQLLVPLCPPSTMLGLVPSCNRCSCNNKQLPPGQPGPRADQDQYLYHRSLDTWWPPGKERCRGSGAAVNQKPAFPSRLATLSSVEANSFQYKPFPPPNPPNQQIQMVCGRILENIQTTENPSLVNRHSFLKVCYEAHVTLIAKPDEERISK